MDRNIVNICCLFVIILLAPHCSCYHKFHKPEYAFHLDNAGNAIAGFVDSGVKEGSKVLVNPAQGHLSLEEGEVVKYLQVKVRSGNFTGDEDYVLENTNAFKVDENGYIIVNNTEKFNHFGVFEFYVVMFRLADIVLGSSTVYCWGHLNIKPFIFYLKSKYVFFNEIHFDLNFKFVTNIMSLVFIYSFQSTNTQGIHIYFTGTSNIKFCLTAMLF
ncbi:Hypothetical predicted protein [Mytilus galloprovincialis]|uniref:Uncharacterized protein n=1 Tax=Mytilus galloprovincialis TaxID=29158 RepID=A0A8B6CMZ6_MYTGA|nr:Hypothetical predicted protein [Mytilus galloprovincialis]